MELKLYDTYAIYLRPGDWLYIGIDQGSEKVGKFHVFQDTENITNFVVLNEAFIQILVRNKS